MQQGKQRASRAIEDLDIRVVATITGELLRRLTIDTTRDYQPIGKPPGPTRQKRGTPEPN